MINNIEQLKKNNDSDKQLQRKTLKSLRFRKRICNKKFIS